MKRYNVRKVFLFLSFLILSMTFFACNNVKETEEKDIKSIEAYVSNLKHEEKKYSIHIINYEIEKARELLESEDNQETKNKIFNETITRINNLLLTEKEVELIKLAYYNYFFEEGIYKPNLDEITIEYSMGKYNGNYIVAMKRFSLGVELPFGKHIEMIGYGKFYINQELLGIVYNQEFCPLKEAYYFRKKVSTEEIKMISENQIIMVS